MTDSTALSSIPLTVAKEAAEQGQKKRVDFALRLLELARLISVALCGLAVLVLAGWLLQSERLMSVMPGRVSMKPNTAVGFMLAGLGLYALLRENQLAHRMARAWAALLLVLVSATLFEYGLGRDFGIDQLLFRDPVQLVNPGRMAAITAVAFLLVSVSLLLATGSRLARRCGQATTLALILIALTSIVGYLYGVPVLYGSFRSVNSMALHTGVGLLLLGFAMLLGQRDSVLGRALRSHDHGGLLLRRFLPLAVLSPVLLGYLYLRPALNFGQLRFSIALFAVTLCLGFSLALIAVAAFINREQAQQRTIAEIALAASREISRSERDLRLVTDHLPTLLSYIDLDGRFVRVNRTYEEWLGRPAAEIVGQELRTLLGEGYAERTRTARQNALKGFTATVETAYPTVKGERCARITYAPDLAEDGTVRGLACMVVDVEDQRSAEAALRQSEKLAAVGRLSSTIAHEINNPVDAVMNMLYLAREQTAEPETRELLAGAEAELRRVAQIAGQTLRFHKQRQVVEPVQAEILFESVLALHEGRLRSRQVVVERRDRTAEPFPCYEGELRQVLNNLVSNAFDASQRGGRLLLRSRTATEWSTGRRGIALTIADNGSGMDEATRMRVFEAFFTTKGMAGTGLGLWISSEILLRHGSQIRVRSSTQASGHGTVFVLFMPFQSPLGDPAS